MELYFEFEQFSASAMKPKNHNASYLDVSQFILKEHSPLFKPRPIDQPIESHHHPNYEISQDVSPILEGKITIAMTPLFDRNRLDPFKQANPDQFQSFTLDGNSIEQKSKKYKRARPRLPSSYYIVENELEGIIEQNDQGEYEINYSEQDSQYSNQESHIQDDNEQLSDSQVQEAQNQKQSNTVYQISNYQFKCPEWQAANPKKQLINKLKQIAANQQLRTYQQKINNIKQVFCKYLCEYEKYYFQQSMAVIQKQIQDKSSQDKDKDKDKGNSQNGNIDEVVAILIKGIEQTFRREIRGLSFEKRRLKLLRYLDKKKRRVWRKKVSYDCRKKVADGRLRIKGKFVTYQQACLQLGLPSVEGYTPDQIKEMLYRKLEHS